MLWSLTRLSMLSAGLLLAMHVQAVAFNIDSFEGIAVGKPINLTWWGDKTVRLTNVFHPNIRTDASHALSPPP